MLNALLQAKVEYLGYLNYMIMKEGGAKPLNLGLALPILQFAICHLFDFNCFHFAFT